jgi:hypothetical protein
MNKTILIILGGNYIHRRRSSCPAGHILYRVGGTTKVVP